MSGRIILKFICEGWSGTGWVDLAYDRNQWRVVVNTVMKLRVLGEFLSSCTTGGFSRKAHPRSFLFASGVGLSPLYCGHFWSIVPAPDERWGWLWSNLWNEDWQRKPKYSEKTCPSATLSTTNPTWPDLGSAMGSQRLTSIQLVS
jgi:hypothetical protein